MDSRLTFDRRSGFTLLENAFAVSMIVLTAIPLVGLLSLSSGSQLRAAHGRDAARIAMQISSEMAQSSALTGLLVPEGGLESGEEWPYLNDSASDSLDGETVYLSYGSDFLPRGTISAAEYENGVELNEAGDEEFAVFAVKIRFERREGPSVEMASTGKYFESYVAMITVGAPAAAPVAARQSETFSTILSGTDATSDEPFKSNHGGS